MLDWLRRTDTLAASIREQQMEVEELTRDLTAIAAAVREERPSAELEAAVRDLQLEQAPLRNDVTSGMNEILHHLK